MSLTNVQIKKGFWYHDTNNDFTPSAIIYYKDYKSSEKLNLYITQTGLKPYQQKKNIKTWCEVLSNLKEIRYLWFSSKINQKIFDTICEMTNLKGLYIKWSNINNIKNIIKMKHLKHFHLGSSAQIENIDILSEMNNLITLELKNLKKISDFSMISKLKNLEGLVLDGSMWIYQNIQSLKPLENLTNLKYLSIVSSRVIDKKFDSILKLKKLIRFDFSLNYPEEEIKKLEKLTNLKYSNIMTIKKIFMSA